MSRKVYRLTPAEAAVINERRDQEERKSKSNEFQFEAIQVAAKWMRWSKKTGLALGYGTFVNTFGYDSDDNRLMYEVVQRIVKAAYVEF